MSKRWLAAVSCVVIAGRVAVGAELLTLSAENYQASIPAGKETDAIFGDYVLRNAQIVAVVADPTIHRGRSASRKWGVSIPGCLIDLTRREAPNDLLGVFVPSFVTPDSRGADAPAGDPGEPHHQGEFRDESTYYLLPGREPQSAPEVTLALPFMGRCLEVQYKLADDWDFIEVTARFTTNPRHRRGGGNPKVLSPATMITLGPDSLRTSDQVMYGGDADLRLSWIYDPWFHQAYGVSTVSHATEPFILGNRLSYLLQKATEAFVADGDVVTTVTRVIPGRDVCQVRETAQRLAGVTARKVSFEVTASDGPVDNALVTIFRDGAVYAAARTDVAGRLLTQLPAGAFTAKVAAFGRPPQTVAIAPAGEAAYAVNCAAAARLRVQVSDADGAAIPCKLELRGVGETSDPDFFPASGDQLVRNLIYLHDGRCDVIVPPGTYELLASHGAEFDMHRQSAVLPAGEVTEATIELARVVDSSGWISADFANRSTISRPFTVATVSGRLRNLLAEHIEFAPATERDTIYSYAPALAELNGQSRLATCPGIGLTERVRKTVTNQNCFPVIYRPGAQDGGAPQRPQHVYQVFWLNGWYGPLVGDEQNAGYIGGTEKLIQVTPPDIWENDGRWHGMWMLFSDMTRLHTSLRAGFLVTHRNNRMNHLRCFHAMELQPLTTFVHLPEFDPADPTNTAEQEAWQQEMDEWSRTRKWPQLKDANRHWLRMLELGWRITGVVNTNRYDNFHGSGLYRSYIRSATDQPSELEPLELVRAVKAGQVTMTTGPFLTVEVAAADHTAGPGEDLQAPAGKAELRVRVQCPNWIQVDEVEVLFNGRSVADLRRRRETQATLFSDGPTQFDQVLPLALMVDTRVMVVASGAGVALHGEQERETRVPHVAMSNPIYVDVDGNGFKPHPPWQDRVYTRMDPLSPLLAGAAAEPAQVVMKLVNIGTAPAADTFSLMIRPAGAATVVGDNYFSYQLGPGEGTEIRFAVALAPGTDASLVRVSAARSSAGVGRRPCAYAFKVNDQRLRPPAFLKGAGNWWLPQDDKQRPANWLWPEFGR